jgi:hypothetical protein
MLLQQEALREYDELEAIISEHAAGQTKMQNFMGTDGGDDVLSLLDAGAKDYRTRISQNRIRSSSSRSHTHAVLCVRVVTEFVQPFLSLLGYQRV